MAAHATWLTTPAVTVLDRVIGWISPRTALTRYVDRIRLQRAYEAASPRDGWRPRRGGASANTDHQADAATIRTKARSLVQNVPYIRAGMDALVANTIGTGIVTYPTGPSAKAIQKLLAEWMPVCDADGRLDWYGMQAAADRAMDQDGEVLIRLRPRPASDGYPVPLQLQLLEIDWLDSSRITGASGQNQIINGIEYDVLGRAVKYWLFDRHPGDIGLVAGKARMQSRPVDADKIIHLYAPERPGQGRGFSRLAPVIAPVRDLQLYEDAEAARKNLETRLSVLVTGDPAAMAGPGSDGTPGDPVKAAQTGDLGELRSGGITGLPPGMNVTTVQPKAAEGYVEYVKLRLHIIAAGMGVTYEMLTGDMKDVNFSSARVRLIDFRRQVEASQWMTLIPRLCVPVYRAFIDAAVLAGKLRAAEYQCDHSTPKWDYVNPEQDAKCDLALISGSLLTISESLRRRGYKPEDVFAEMQSDFDTLKRLGVLDIMLALQGKVPAPDAAAAADAKASAARADDDRANRISQEVSQEIRDAVAQMLRTLDQRAAAETAAQGAEAQSQALRQAVEKLGEMANAAVGTARAAVERPPQPVSLSIEQPGVTIHNRTEVAPTPPADVHLHVEPTPVHHHVENRFEPNVNVSTPRRRVDGLVERDDKGRILRTTQIETDLPSQE